MKNIIATPKALLSVSLPQRRIVSMNTRPDTVSTTKNAIINKPAEIVSFIITSLNKNDF